MFLFKPYHSGQFSHCVVLEVTAMVSENLFTNTETHDNLVENEKSRSFPISLEGGHCLCPLCKVIHSDNDIFVPPSRGWVTHHIVNPPLHEGGH